MRPPRDDIAAPELPPRLRWIGAAPASMAELTAAGPVLVHFFDFAQLNSVRSLPYVIEWARRYEPTGLSVIGVQAPRFPFGAEPDAASAALARLGVGFPVALDGERELWLDYGCEGWPSLFLWSRGGALRWVHFGEGEYAASEEAIQSELREIDAVRSLPAPMAPLRRADAPGALVMPPSAEVTPGGEQGPWRPGPDADSLELRYEAGGAFATAAGKGRLSVAVDGTPAAEVAVDGAFLYELTEHERHEPHELRLGASDGVEIWSISFAAGLP